MNARIAMLAALGSAALLAGCAKDGDIVVDQGVGITALRSVCPAVGIPDYTGDITTFLASGSGAQTADALDVTAAITNVRSTCNDQGALVYTDATFDVIAVRRNTAGARTVELPYFSTVMRGGNTVVAKRVGTVTLNFADGAARAQASGRAGSYVDRAEATIPEDIRQQITQRRRAGDETAAVDPLTLPEVRAAVARATFDLLIGFQLTQDQLRYNATR
ncbi:hypothetical protein GRI62_02295 [Erythrobacter arachoides]|uniref:Lipoprotein n=1 Tax=Aurantiacibacter arachoides TaxID=1850444 RepID=A0A844ZX16_9SPHN|nr:hypothetical protein [Aurantiacibacter arachoides]MXO92435.1 hypothetical protein [Aurantiacibacter arachoides]GGD57178.1 hypothetical protein GCM10011411_16540 [Aurantiacibacter arachoides]